MPLLNQTTLTERLFTAEADLASLGWALPDYLFALSAPRDDLLLELWMEMPGGAAPFLAALCDLGLQASQETRGLVVVVSGGPSYLRTTLGLPPMGTLRSLCAKAGVPVEELASRLPQRPPRVATQRRRVRALLGVLRTGATTVILHEVGSVPRVVPYLPTELGDHDVLTSLAMRVLA